MGQQQVMKEQAKVAEGVLDLFWVVRLGTSSQSITLNNQNPNCKEFISTSNN